MEFHTTVQGFPEKVRDLKLPPENFIYQGHQPTPSSIFDKGKKQQMK